MLLFNPSKLSSIDHFVEEYVTFLHLQFNVVVTTTYKYTKCYFIYLLQISYWLILVINLHSYYIENVFV